MNNLEDKVKAKRVTANRKIFDKELQGIVLDIGFSWSQTTHYSLIVVLCWNNKELIACHMDTSLEKDNTILNTIIDAFSPTQW